MEVQEVPKEEILESGILCLIWRPLQGVLTVHRKLYTCFQLDTSDISSVPAAYVKYMLSCRALGQVRYRYCVLEGGPEDIELCFSDKKMLGGFHVDYLPNCAKFPTINSILERLSIKEGRAVLLPQAGILMVQHFPGTGEYVVYREGGAVEHYHGGSNIRDSDFYQYAQECAAAGFSRSTSFKVPVGGPGVSRTIDCKQVIYCKTFVTKALPDSLEMKSPGGSRKIAWVRWAPALYELTVGTGGFQLPKTNKVTSLSEAPVDVIDFIRTCLQEGRIALSRNYSRPVQSGRATRLVSVTEYYFSISKVTKDFQGPNVALVTDEDMPAIGLALGQ